MDEGYFLNSRALYYFIQHNRIYFRMFVWIFWTRDERMQKQTCLCMFIKQVHRYKQKHKIMKSIEIRAQRPLIA